MIRQGDVLITTKTDAVIPANAKPVPARGGRLILAEGEATGHHHSVSSNAAQLFAVDERMIMVVAEPTTLDHQEHSKIEIAPGTYWVTRQREYSPQAIRRVMD